VCAEERRELSLPAAAAGLKTTGYGRMATHRTGGVLPGGHSPSALDSAPDLLHICTQVAHIDPGSPIDQLENSMSGDLLGKNIGCGLSG
jgi:hypothetical protein